MKKLYWLLILILFVGTDVYGNQGRTSHADKEQFATSFIKHYECNSTGKFTHEYHPYLLRQTADSFLTLEQAFERAKLPIVGRIGLMGYEEQGIPVYTTDYQDPGLTDEMAVKTDAGWSLRMYNRFGALTGFLFKDIVQRNQERSAAGKLPVPLTHIDAHDVSLFDGLGTLFQEHAFGDAYRLALDTFATTNTLLYQSGELAVLSPVLLTFWQQLYTDQLKVSGKQHVVGTQDILFSISYLSHLSRSAVPLLHLYTGPDITYPIEATQEHDQFATRHAQSFIPHIIKQLVPRNGKKTAYVFCSFVDGVGKSTLLGNIQNWMKHGRDVLSYEHVDNSSSQLATIFSFAPDVLIADLPAQVSHYTYKPDGHVFVDVMAADMPSATQQRIVQVALEHDHELRAQFARLREQCCAARAQRTTDQYSWYTELFSGTDTTPEHYCLLYAANTVLQRVPLTDDAWIPMVYDTNCYLYQKTDTGVGLRVCTPIAQAPSHGLKNSEPSQMIFDLGVRFPLHFDHFTSDLTTRLQAAGAEQVVMVDFLSMYSRSSRENIRVNYVLTQLALLAPEFSQKYSFYQPVTSNAQLLALLDTSELRAQYAHSLRDEALLRTELYELLCLYTREKNIDGISLHALSKLLIERLADTGSLYTTIASCAEHKVTKTWQQLIYAHGLSRAFICGAQNSLADVVAFTRTVVIPCFANWTCDHGGNQQQLWRRFVGRETLAYNSMYLQGPTHNQSGTVRFPDGSFGYVLARVAPDCTDMSVLTDIIRYVRSAWYAAFSNLLYTTGTDENDCLWYHLKYPVPPIGVFNDDNGGICVVQLMLDQVDGERFTKEQGAHNPDYRLFNIPAVDRCDAWECYEGQLYFADWMTVTHTGQEVYAFGHMYSQTDQSKSSDDLLYGSYSYNYMPCLTEVFERFSKDFGEENVMPTAFAVDLLAGSQAHVARAHHRFITRRLKKAATFSYTHKLKKVERDEWYFPIGEEKIVLALPEQYAGIRLMIRALVTLDMVCKDPQSDIVVRKNNTADVVAACTLFEDYTLPRVYGLYCTEPLFEDEGEKTVFPCYTAR